MTDKSATSRARCVGVHLAVAGALFATPLLFSAVSTPAHAGSVELNLVHGFRYQVHDRTAYGPKLTEMLVPFRPSMEVAAPAPQPSSDAIAGVKLTPQSVFGGTSQDIGSTNGNVPTAGFAFLSDSWRQNTSAPTRPTTGWKWEPFFPQAQAAVTYGPTGTNTPAASPDEPAYPTLNAETLLSAKLSSDGFGAVRYHFADISSEKSADTLGTDKESSLPGVMWIFLSGLFLLAILRRRQDDAPQEV